MFKLLLRIVAIAGIAAAALGQSQATERGATAMAADAYGKPSFPRRSHALVIGINDYTAGWPTLNNAVADAQAVAEVLEAKGFDVTLGLNPTSDELRNLLENFVFEQGAEADSELLIWFAGHGHTIDGEGYLVPSDAPLPGDLDSAFRRKALSMRRFGEYMREMRSRHVLSIFDSCFSGTIFSLDRGEPPAVELARMMPVRQFISSGDATQTVSDDTTFRKLFVEAVEGRAPSADANDDGYLTGSELGLFMRYRLTNLTAMRQTPGFGKLNAIGFDGGDFVFALPNAPKSARPSKELPGRATIADRNGAVLAANLDVASLRIHPQEITDLDRAAEFLTTVLPHADPEELYARLSGAAPSTVVRGLTTDQQERILSAGMPGIRIETGVSRVHPGGPAIAWIVGDVDAQNRGESGLEQFLDNMSAVARTDGFALRSSIDLRIQNFVSTELADALSRYKARQAGAIVTDVRTGEVLALASVAQPGRDFGSNIVSFSFEPGSLSKAFTTASALDSAAFSINSTFDVASLSRSMALPCEIM